ncbi:sulfurtransferase complex subunit TusC [Gilvimarinus sp. SDUM040013]|uniref:Sulfurtransferase complex subunit TusC n=1 Tax=Gilvimarinus gilvus TaxID=3058038 RepID=A0ABU4RYY4_9GAMM|nr:sulfurtransferase complex subunit TusC [Gilvimarinus sp. SDUM040013]MDO3385731.1 sulfurtransferase complex subunit TusC [Gilvimarinus sp. SDUM040013]MDX6849371.1 sulfurtransferase complex subunit TusC [Gilvimarinus sp. SDUM040013]
MSRILCVSRHAPYQTSHANDALDAVLAAGAFDQDIGLLLIDEGVWQLVTQQDAPYVGKKDLSKKLCALALYGIENIFVHEPSLQGRLLTRDSLCLDNVQLLTNKETRQLFDQYEQILSF